MRHGAASVSRLSWYRSNGACPEHAGGARSDAASYACGTARSGHSRWRTLLGAVTAALTLGALVSLLGASAAAAAVGSPFSCQSEVDFLTQTHTDGEATKFFESEFKVRGSRIQRSQLQIRRLDVQRARLRPDERLPLLDRAQRQPRPARPAPSSRSTTPATQRRSGSSKATRPKAAGPRTAPSTRKGTTGSPTGTARRSPTRSTSAKSK